MVQKIRPTYTDMGEGRLINANTVETHYVQVENNQSGHSMTMQNMIDRVYGWTGAVWTPTSFQALGLEQTYRLKDENSGYAINIFMITQTDYSNQPMLATDQGLLVQKDVSCGGFLGTNQGAVGFGHGLNQYNQPPILWLTHSNTMIGGATYYYDAEGIPGSVNYDTLNVCDVTGNTLCNFRARNYIIGGSLFFTDNVDVYGSPVKTSYINLDNEGNLIIRATSETLLPYADTLMVLGSESFRFKAIYAESISGSAASSTIPEIWTNTIYPNDTTDVTLYNTLTIYDSLQPALYFDIENTKLSIIHDATKALITSHAGNLHLAANHTIVMDNNVNIQTNAPFMSLYDADTIKVADFSHDGSKLEINSNSGTLRLKSEDNDIVVSNTVLPEFTASYDLGSSSQAFRNGYFQGSLEIRDATSGTYSPILKTLWVPRDIYGGTWPANHPMLMCTEHFGGSRDIWVYGAFFSAEGSIYLSADHDADNTKHIGNRGDCIETDTTIAVNVTNPSILLQESEVSRLSLLGTGTNQYITAHIGELILTAVGAVRPVTANNISLGTQSYYWQNVYGGNVTTDHMYALSGNTIEFHDNVTFTGIYPTTYGNQSAINHQSLGGLDKENHFVAGNNLSWDNNTLNVSNTLSTFDGGTITNNLIISNGDPGIIFNNSGAQMSIYGGTSYAGGTYSLIAGHTHPIWIAGPSGTTIGMTGNPVATGVLTVSNFSPYNIQRGVTSTNASGLATVSFSTAFAGVPIVVATAGGGGDVILNIVSRTTSNFVVHTKKVSSSSSSDGSHNHAIYGGITTSGYHTHSGDGGHTHPVSDQSTQHYHSVGGTTSYIAVGTPGINHTHSSGGAGVEETSYSGIHNHTTSSTTHSHTGGSHTHTDNFSTGTESNHDHNVTYDDVSAAFTWIAIMA